MKIKYTLIPFILGLLLLIPYGICQMAELKIIKNFTLIPTDTMYTIFGVISFLFMVCIFVLSFLSKDEPNNVQLGKSYVLGILSALISLFLICIGGVILLSVILFREYVYPIFQSFLLSILSILTGISFIMLSEGYFYGSNPFKKHSIIAIFPTLWVLDQLIICFISNTTTSNTRLHSLHIVELAALLLFLFNHARQFVPVEMKNSTKRLFAYGLIFIFISCIYNISVIILKFRDMPNYSSGYNINCIANLFLIIYISIILMNVYQKIYYPRAISRNNV